MRRSSLAALIWLSVVAAAPMGVRADGGDLIRAEARARFDRGLRLFNQSDNTGALTEFLRAYELRPHPLVLYNIALVHAVLGNSVEAVAAIDQLLVQAGSLEPEKVERLQSERAIHAARIGQLSVTVPVRDAIVQLDGIDVGRAPVTLSVTRGEHTVAVVAPGYTPSRKRVFVAAQSSVTAAFELVPSERQWAVLRIDAPVPGMEVHVNGELVGRTPLPSSLALAEGSHAIELRRAGYVPTRRVIALGPGTSGTVAVRPELDWGALPATAGELALHISEPEAVLFIDGEPIGAYRGPLRLPAGEHWLRVERHGFFPVTRRVQVPRGARARVRIDLEPTPDQRVAYRDQANRRRVGSWIGVGAGALVAAGGGAFLVWNQNAKRTAKDNFEAEAARHEPGGDCAKNANQSQACIEALEIALEKLEDTRARDRYGWIGVGLGAAAIGASLIWLVTGDDPERYSPRPESDVFGTLVIRPVVAPRAAGADLTWAF